MSDLFSTNRNPEIKLFFLLAATLLFFLIVSLVWGAKVERDDKSVPTQVATIPFPQIEVNAKAVYVYDVRAGTTLFAKNEDVRLPLASLTKVMSAVVAEDSSPLYGTVTISSEALMTEGDSGLFRDERWSLKDILDFSLLTSSNDGMRAVALSLGALHRANATSSLIINDFVVKMNSKAGELGLKNTYFSNETGLDESEVKGGAYGSARDMSALFEYILLSHPELLESTRETVATFQSIDNHLHIGKNTNSMAGEIPGLMASKTGFTDTAGGNLVIAFDPELGRPFIISILGSTEQGRFEDARNLVAAVMEYINN
ncbi:MAG: hypothetical protein WD896_02740 [Parcubacteria group bacterium]